MLTFLKKLSPANWKAAAFVLAKPKAASIPVELLPPASVEKRARGEGLHRPQAKSPLQPGDHPFLHM